MTDERMVATSLTLKPHHLAAANAFAKDMGYDSTSAAIRRIIDEWLLFKAEQLPLAALMPERPTYRTK
jgi:hypothetical protein